MFTHVPNEKLQEIAAIRKQMHEAVVSGDFTLVIKLYEECGDKSFKIIADELDRAEKARGE
jgi:hypothetical protein